MAAQWTIHKTPGAGLSGGLAQAYADEMRVRDNSDEVALLVPTQAAAEIARRIVLESGASALLDARIMTFPQLAELILVANRREAREITPLQRELLIGDVLARLAESGELDYLQTTWDKPGTIAAVGALIDEIKRGGVSSDDFPRLVAAHAREHPANGPLSAVFAQYQQRLHDLDLYDEPGLFWSALETLQAGERKPLEGLRVLLIDGFQEFTTTQLHMLQTLAESVEHIVICLWIDEKREHLTPRSRETLQRLQELVAPEMLAEDEAPENSETALEQLRARLFSITEAGLTTPDNSVQIVEAAGGTVGECREIARRIKRLLKARPDLPPHQVAVFLRSWDTGYDTALRQALDWYGVPADFAQGPALAAVPAVQAALGVLDVVTGGWLRQDVIKLLNSNYVLPLLEGEPRLSARRLEQLALEAGIIGGALEAGQGKAAWDRGLKQLKLRLSDERAKRRDLDESRGVSAGNEDSVRVLEDEDGNRYRPLSQIERATAFVERAQTLVNRLAELLAPLETATTMASAAKAFEEAVATLQIVKTAGWGSAERVVLDLQGLEELSQLLRAMTESPEVLQIGTGANVQQFANCLRQACSSTHLSGTRHRRTGVQVLDLAQAGLERYTVAVVCGLRDGVFPARGRPDVFYSDTARAVLQQALPGLRPRLGDRHDDEHLLCGALAAADEQVWLTYPCTEASGAPVLRSLYVDEVVRHWQSDEHDHPPKGLVQRRGQAEVIAPLADAYQYLEALEALQTLPVPATDTDLDQLNMARGDVWPELALVKALGEMETRRTSDAPADVFSGRLAGTDLVPQLAADYGPEHTYSVSQINTYAGCPMRFFFERVLGLDAPDEPTEGLDRRDLGSLVHRILAMFFSERTIGRDECEPLTLDNVEQAQADLERCIAAACDDQAGKVFGAQSVWDRAKERFRQDLAELLLFEAKQHQPDAPALVRDVEVFFGKDRSFCLVPNDGGDPIYLRGRIDRADLMTVGSEPRWVIWDYKTYDGVARKLVLNATDVQLAVYALAVDHVFPGEAAGSASWGYYRVARPIGHANVVSPTNATPTRLVDATKAAVASIGKAVAAIRGGEFACAPSDGLKPCKYCDFGSVCRTPRQVK
jgi:ATP-dependent helicase/DNAse subunit B